MKYGMVVDGFLHASKIPTRTRKWLTAEKQTGMIKSLFDFERKQEELEGKVIHYDLGRNNSLKRVTDARSNLSKRACFY